MTEERIANLHGEAADDSNSRRGVPPATVASLGLRMRLVAADPERERQRSDLITACETLRVEWECLFQQIIGYLSDDDHRTCPDNHPAPGSDL